MPIGPGTRLGPYEVTALIGEGGMGKVWRAYHTALNRRPRLTQPSEDRVAKPVQPAYLVILDFGG